MYTGHQYAAVKMPADAVSIFGNEFNLVSLSEYEESVVSPELESLAKENGFAVYGETGELNIMATYSMPFFDYSHMRTWNGHRLMAPSAYGDYEPESVYPLTFYADKKVSVTDVFSLMRNRFEDTEYSPDDTGRTDMRVIGTDTALSVHVVQTYPDLPADMAVVTWESSGPAAYGVFVPVSNCSTAVSSVYGTNQPHSDFGDFDTEHYAYYLFKGLNTLCCVTNAETYGRPIQEYWKAAEGKMAEGMAEVLKIACENRDKSEKEAAEYVTAYCVSMQEAAFRDGQKLLNGVNWLMAKNSNTMRKGVNPETHEVLDEDKPLTPFEPDGNLSAYGAVQEYAPSGSMNQGLMIAMISAFAVIVLLAAICLMKRRTKNSSC